MAWREHCQRIVASVFNCHAILSFKSVKVRNACLDCWSFEAQLLSDWSSAEADCCCQRVSTLSIRLWLVLTAIVEHLCFALHKVVQTPHHGSQRITMKYRWTCIKEHKCVMLKINWDFDCNIRTLEQRKIV